MDNIENYILLKTVAEELRTSSSVLSRSPIVKKYIRKINNRLYLEKDFYEKYKIEISERKSIKKPEWIGRDANT